MNRKLLVYITLAAIAALVFLSVEFYMNWNAREIQLPAVIDRDSKIIYFSNGKSPLEVRMRVLDFSGEAIGGVAVDVRTDSGGNLGSTDDNGLAVISLGESSIEQILVNGMNYFGDFNSPHARHLDVTNGLSILVLQDKAMEK